ncbi:MAG: G5 domain-containing protein [Clostridiales bacterium]|nr:G5 domain-containing protein [Clostridiales bacterium]
MAKKLPVLLVVFLALFLFKGEAKALEEYMTVRVNVDGTSEAYITTQKTVGGFLEEQGIILNEKDQINYDPSSKLLNRTIEIVRAFDLVIYIDGAPQRVRIAPETKVGNLLAEIKRETGIEYYHEHILAELITPQSVLNFSTLTAETVKEPFAIEFVSEVIENPDMYEGETSVVQEGLAGVGENTYVVTYRLGIEESRMIVNTEIITEPVNRIEHFGTKPKEPEIPGVPTQYLRVIEMRASGYSAGYESTGKNPGDRGYGITKTGLYVMPGVVAVDPSFIPLGTKLYVEGYGPALAADTGSAIRGNMIDLYFESDADATNYGRKTLNVYVIEEATDEDIFAVSQKYLLGIIPEDVPEEAPDLADAAEDEAADTAETAAGTVNTEIIVTEIFELSEEYSPDAAV